jgi:crossover junction endodeoxyribonuclease RuvC
MTKRILGIDPGLLHTGWAVIDADGARLTYVASGVISPRAKDPLAIRLATIFNAMREICAAFSPNEISIEITFLNANPTSTLLLGHARAAAIVAVGTFDLPVFEYEPNAIKKALTGRGHADKEQVKALLRIFFPDASPKTADESDALAIATTHAHTSRVLMRRA